MDWDCEYSQDERDLTFASNLGTKSQAIENKQSRV